MHEALGENGVLDDADAGGGGKQGGHLRLHVGGVARIGGGADFHALGDSLAAMDGADIARVVEVHTVTGCFDGGGDGLEVFAIDAAEGDALTGEGGGGHEGAGFDTVRDDGVLDAMKFLYPLDDDAAGASTGDFRTHGVEEIREIEDFRLGGGGLDDGDAFGEGGGHHDIVGAEDGGAVGATEVDFRSAEAVLSGEGDVPAFDFDFRAEGFESTEVEIDRAIADDAAAGKGDDAAALAGEKRAHDADGGAHPADQLVGGVVDDVGASYADGAGGALDVGTEGAEDLNHVICVRDIGHAADDAVVSGEEGGGEDGE